MTKRKPPSPPLPPDKISSLAARLGRLGGLRNTPAQLAARRKNGKKGGRPPKQSLPKGFK